MDVKPLKDASIYSIQQKYSDEQKLPKKSDAEEINQKSSSEITDKVEISEEAKLSSMLDNAEIRDKIKSGFYDNPDVLYQVAKKLYEDLNIEQK